ncbi:MAG TPA: YidC/Oxa1 family membrane protein insertase, partial [Chloroflexota bacterium]|nr:YidC/Oxa1 family membrane protein insertase [Chloroflexota bacterium]
MLLSCFALLASRVDPAALASLPPAAIPIWDQYVDLIEWALRSLADYFGSGGLSIIVFTIFVKTLLLPLTVQSLRSSKAMQELQPKIKELQKKYGKDRQRLTQETMRLYSEHHVNPMSGCLPMLLQIPIFLGLYNAINHLSRSEEGPWSGTFLWLSDGLNERDPFYILPVMAGLFQFVQTRMMRPRNQGKITDPQQAMMNTMMNFMPLMVVIFGWTFDSGPVLYWVAQSVYSVIQQWFITGWGSLGEWFPWLPELPEHRRLGYRPPRPPQAQDPVVMSGDEKYPVRAPGAMGWFQRKMEQQLE